METASEINPMEREPVSEFPEAIESAAAAREGVEPERALRVPSVPKAEDSDTLEWRGFVRLAVGEVPIRNFYIARLFIPSRARLNILVTNLRVILYGAGGRGVLGRQRLVQELHLDRIIGVEGFIGWGFNLIMLGLGIVFLVVGASPYSGLAPNLSRLATPRLASLWYTLIVLGITLIVLCFRQLFYVYIKPMSVSLDISVTAKRGFGWRGGGSLVYAQKPGRDAAALVRELGAVILDAQNGEGTPEPSFLYPAGMGPNAGLGPENDTPGFDTGDRGEDLPPDFDEFLHEEEPEATRGILRLRRQGDLGSLQRRMTED